MNREYSLFGRGDRVLDLGSFPGSWSLYALKMVGRGGLVVSLDRKECPLLKGKVHYLFVADIMEFDHSALIPFFPFDCILSDLAPKTTGIKLKDQSESMKLAMKAFEIALSYLAKGGNFLCKVFMSQDVQHLIQRMKRHFKRVELSKPEGSRKRSSEIYIVCLHLSKT